MAAQMLDELLRAAAERTPLAPAVSAADGELSYRELHELASRIGAGLRELGVRPGDRVGLLGGKTTATVAGVHGVLYSGGGYIPLDPTAPPARWARLIADCGVHVVAGEAGLLRRLDEVTPGLRAVVLNGAAYRSGMIAIPDEGCAPGPGRSGAAGLHPLHLRVDRRAQGRGVQPPRLPQLRALGGARVRGPVGGRGEQPLPVPL